MTSEAIIKWLKMRRFYTTKVFPKDGEHLLIDGEEYIAHLKEKNEKCERCCFNTKAGCGVTLDKLDCYDVMNDRRYYFEKGAPDGEEIITEESKESV